MVLVEHRKEFLNMDGVIIAIAIVLSIMLISIYFYIEDRLDSKIL